MIYKTRSSPPALLGGLLTYLGAGQALRALTRRIVLFPQRRAERQLGRVLFPVLQALATGRTVPPPTRVDLSAYTA